MKNNKGFSLVEMLVVIAISAVLAGASISMLSLLSSGQIIKNAREVASMLAETKQRTMTQNQSGGFFFAMDCSDNTPKISSNKTTPTSLDTVGYMELKPCKAYYVSASGDKKELTSVGVKFNSSTGAVNEVNLVYADAGSTTLRNGTGVVTIEFVKGGKSSNVNIYLPTGKVEYE